VDEESDGSHGHCKVDPEISIEVRCEFALLEPDLPGPGEGVRPDPFQGLIASEQGVDVDGGQVDPVACRAGEIHDHVLSGSSHAVGGAFEDEQVAPAFALQPVGAGAGEQPVPPRPSVELVGARPSAERIVASLAVETVVPGKTGQMIRECIAEEQVGRAVTGAVESASLAENEFST